jgi:hypothetical protein
MTPNTITSTLAAQTASESSVSIGSGSKGQGDSAAWLMSCRFDLIAHFVTLRPMVVHEFDSELQMARFCKTAWPCDKTRRI